MRVLVAYGSTRGGTAGLAHMVADALARHRISTEVRPAGDVRALDDVEAVIVGGALYSNRWHPDAVAFIGRHREELQKLPVWFFSSGPLDDTARSGALAAVPQVSSLARDVEIRGHMTFGGLLDKKPSGLFGKFGWGAVGDFRDRHHVAEWVERIAADLSGELTPTVRVIDDHPPTTEEPLAPPVPPVPPPPPPTARSAYDRVFLATGWPADGIKDEQDGFPPATVEPEPTDEVQPEPDNPSRHRLRRYLRLEEDVDDEGLDLFEDAF